MSLRYEKTLSAEFPTRSDTNRPAQPLEKIWSLKLGLERQADYSIRVTKKKALVSLHTSLFSHMPKYNTKNKTKNKKQQQQQQQQKNVVFD